MPERELNITAFPRLHLTLIGMNDDGYRVNGGVGFAIDNPTIDIKCKPNDQLQIFDYRDRAMSIEEKTRLGNIIKSVIDEYRFKTSLHVEVSGFAGCHVGLGTGTAIRLSIIEGLFILNNHPIDRAELVKLSKRGGTSGVGIHTYFNGGFVFDIGRPFLKSRFSPSSTNELLNFNLPLALIEKAMPNWSLGVCIPNSIVSKTEDEEKSFFIETCPISNEEVYKTLYHSLYGITAAILDGNQSIFETALTALQDCAWKRAERCLYNDQLIDFENRLYSLGARAVGMSSLGPLLFYFADDVSRINSELSQGKTRPFCLHVKPVNTGRIIKYA